MKKRVKTYCLIYEKNGKLQKELFTNLEKLFNNAKFLIGCGYDLQISIILLECDI